MRFLSVIVFTSALTASAFAQGQYKAPRTPDGHPDFQGFWENNIATPLERPKELAGRATITDAEVDKLRKKARELFASGDGDAAFFDGYYLTVLANVLGTKQGFKSVDGETGDYSSVWNDERTWENRTSLITDPADGRMPPMTARAQAQRAAAGKAMQRPAEGPEDRLLAERCITYGSPQLISGYQAFYQIVEAPNAVMLMTEMFHDVRVVNMDNRPHPSPAVKEWHGDSRGHWEGDTLVVDTTNYLPRAFQSISSDKLHVTERFTRYDAETLRYQITIDDPDTWEKPFTLMIPLRRSSKPVFEYACHEGNYGLQDILAGARADDAKMAAAAKQ